MTSLRYFPDGKLAYSFVIIISYSKIKFLIIIIHILDNHSLTYNIIKYVTQN